MFPVEDKIIQDTRMTIYADTGKVPSQSDTVRYLIREGNKAVQAKKNV